jgi:hypothetical protein
MPFFSFEVALDVMLLWNPLLLSFMICKVSSGRPIVLTHLGELMRLLNGVTQGKSICDQLSMADKISTNY